MVSTPALTRNYLNNNDYFFYLFIDDIQKQKKHLYRKLKNLKEFKKNIMRAKKQVNLTSRDDYIDAKCGKLETPVREEWEQEFEAFKQGVLLGKRRLKLEGLITIG